MVNVKTVETTLLTAFPSENCRKITLEEEALVPLLKAMGQTKDGRLIERLIWAVSYYALDGEPLAFLVSFFPMFIV